MMTVVQRLRGVTTTGEHRPEGKNRPPRPLLEMVKRDIRAVHSGRTSGEAQTSISGKGQLALVVMLAPQRRGHDYSHRRANCGAEESALGPRHGSSTCRSRSATSFAG
jgi:hypothetical protein